MVTVVNKTTETEVLRAAFALSVTHNGGGGELVVEYRAAAGPAEMADDPAYHHDAISRALEVVAERGWNPHDCTFAVLRLVVSNGPGKHHWYEAVDFLSYSQALAVATGRFHYFAPASLDEATPASAFVDEADDPTAPAAERAGPKSEREDTRDLLAALFGCG